MKAEAQEPAVLEPILASTRRRVEALPAASATRARAPSFAAGLRGEMVAVIAEFKRRSPSAGSIHENADPESFAASYVKGGAAAISVLTEPAHFGGAMSDLRLAARAGVPVLCKDFIIDERQLDECAAAGAAAALLIVRILTDERLRALLGAVRARAMDALVEVHTAAELERAVDAGADIIGVNARDLDTLRVHSELVIALLPRIPRGIVRIAESGIRSREDVERYRDAGADAVLVGTAVAGSADPEAAVRRLSGVKK